MVKKRLADIGLITLLLTIYSGWTLAADTFESGFLTAAIISVTVFVVVTFIVRAGSENQP